MHDTMVGPAMALSLLAIDAGVRESGGPSSGRGVGEHRVIEAPEGRRVDVQEAIAVGDYHQRTRDRGPLQWVFRRLGELAQTRSRPRSRRQWGCHPRQTRESRV
jgi:hypothetical protein